jgi:hypothetical protein
VQRSDGALRLNVHLHTLALDGVYVRNVDGKLEFHALTPPTTAEVYAVAKRMHARVQRLCAKHGLRDELRDEPGEEASALAVCMDAAAQDVSPFGERAGERTKKLVQAVRARIDIREPYSEYVAGACQVATADRGRPNGVS